MARTSAQTIVPFRLESTSKKKVCEGVALDAKMVGAMFKCLVHREKLLIQELASAPTLSVTAIDAPAVPSVLRDLVGGKVAEGERLVTTFINGDGVTYEFVLIIGATPERVGVKAFLVSAEFESG